MKAPSLYVQILIAISCGILLGWLAPDQAVKLKPLGDGLLTLIRMLIAPIIFCTVVGGIAGMGDLKKAGRVGGKALLYFEAMTTVALLLGLGVVHLVGPGRGMHVKAAELDTSQLQKLLDKPQPHGFVEHALALIPESFVGAFVNGEILQVLTLSVLVGIALASMRERKVPLLKGLEHIGAGLFAVMAVVMRLAPIGAFGAMSFTIGKFGVKTLGNLAQLMGSFYAAALLFVIVMLGLVLRYAGLSIFSLIRYLKDELIIVLGTSSSESALPRLMTKLEELGCPSAVVRLVVPTGYSFNLDGTCIYLTMAAVFIAQATDTPMGLGEEVTLLLVLLLTSKGAAAVTGGGFITLAATLPSVGTVPVAGISLLFGIDRFMSEARALTNLVGNAVATIVVSKWEGELNLEQAKAVLAGRAPPVVPDVAVLTKPA